MTTYTLNAIKVVYADIGEGIDAFDYVTLSIVAPESSGFVFSYDNVVVGRPFINTQLEDSSDPTSANFYAGSTTPDVYEVFDSDGINITFMDTTLLALEFDWDVSSRTSILLISGDNVDYVIPTGGDALPTFADGAAWVAYGEDGLRGLHPVTDLSGDFAPDVPWLFEDMLAYVSKSEDDTVFDEDGIDAFNLGAGYDGIAPHFGDDIVDLGETPDDYDTVSYEFDKFVPNHDGLFGLGAISVTFRDAVMTVVDPYGDTDTVTGAEVLIGTEQNDNVTQDGSVDWFRFRGLDGADSYGGHVRTYDSLDYRGDANAGGTAAITADFRGGTFTVIDGFGATDTGSSIDEVRGTAQGDVFYDGGLDMRIRGEAGDDVMFASDGGNDRFEGGADQDELSYELLTGGQGIRVIVNQGLIKDGAGRDIYSDIESIVGSNFRDVFGGSAAADLFSGGAGDDVIRGRGGDDQLFGGLGEDLIIGLGGAEIIYGDDDRDGPGDADIIRSYGGEDTVMGGGGNDVLRLGSGHDIGYGDADDDRIFGQGGDDTIYGGTGADYIEGGNGRDFLSGGDHDDVLRGDASLDTLDGGQGDDTLYGGIGRDTFVFQNGDAGRDVIKDWEDGSDWLDLTSFGFGDFATEVLSLATNVGDLNMRIDLSADMRVVIENFRVEDFDASDVILVG